MTSIAQNLRSSLVSKKPNRSRVPKRRNPQKEKSRAAGTPESIVSKLEQLRSSLSKQQKSSTKVPKEKLYRRLAKTYQYAGKLAEGGPDWTNFCNHEYWRSSKLAPNFDGQQDALRHALRFVFSTTSNPSLQKKVSKYRIALEPSFERRVSPKKLFDRLRENGLGSLGNRPATSEYKINCRLTKEEFEDLEKGSTVTLKIKRVGRTSAEASIVV